MSEKRSTILAKRNPKLKKLIKETHSTIRDWYSIDLTCDQIVDIYNNHPDLYESAYQGFDSLERDWFIDVLCEKIMGCSWPCNGELWAMGDEGAESFFARLTKLANEKGYKIINKKRK